MSHEVYHAMLEAMGAIPLELRIAALFMFVAGIDKTLSDTEETAVSQHMQVSIS
jgi:hypothetical protein